jgi:endonuclease/exonuclease/phosphatase family metal-dependent hydrolase
MAKSKLKPTASGDRSGELPGSGADPAVNEPGMRAEGASRHAPAVNDPGAATPRAGKRARRAFVSARIDARKPAVSRQGGSSRTGSPPKTSSSTTTTPLARRPDPPLGVGGAATLATYNIHRAIGRDGEFDPERVAAVLDEIGADVYALQEVQTGRSGRALIDQLRDRLGAEAISGVTLLRKDAEYGNAILTRYPVRNVERLDLSVSPHEPRGALDVLLDAGTTPLRVLATHLGWGPYERRRQVRWLLAALAAGPDVPTVLMGDINEWFLWGRPLRWLHLQFRRTPAPATFPAHRPVFALDRLWVRPRAVLQRLAVHASPLARVASDHLPLVATLRW